MNTLKNNLNKYKESYKGIVDFFKVNSDLGEIIDYTNCKWYKEDDTHVVIKHKYNYETIEHCVRDVYMTAYYTLVITECKSYVLDNKLKSDKVTLYIENGR